MEVLSHYKNNVFNPESFQTLVPKTIELARKISEEKQFDAIAFCGTSGSALSYILGYTLNIPLICVRKYDDNSHFVRDQKYVGDPSFVEGYMDAKRYLIVDDFICSGKTIKHILYEIKRSLL